MACVAEHCLSFFDWIEIRRPQIHRGGIASPSGSCRIVHVAHRVQSEGPFDTYLLAPPSRRGGDPTSPSATTNGRKTTGYVGQAARPPPGGPPCNFDLFRPNQLFFICHQSFVICHSLA